MRAKVNYCRYIMNRGKKQMTAKDKKKKDKETLNVSKASVPEDVSKETHPWKILAKFPKKVAEKDAAEVKSAAKRVESKKKKLHSKHSKRSTPGQVEEDITPYSHAPRQPDTKKTIKTVEKQSVAKGRRLSSKLSKTKK